MPSITTSHFNRALGISTRDKHVTDREASVLVRAARTPADRAGIAALIARTDVVFDPGTVQRLKAALGGPTTPATPATPAAPTLPGAPATPGTPVAPGVPIGPWSFGLGQAGADQAA